MTAPRAVHLDAGGRPRCGHPRPGQLTGDESAVTCGNCFGLMTGTRITGRQPQRLVLIEDYLFIGGDRMSAAQAAERLGVTCRTVQRYRAELRRAA